MLYKQTDETYKLKLPYITRKDGILLDVPYLPADFKKLKEVRIVPFYDTYKLEIVYEQFTKEKPHTLTKVASIDPGVDNLVTLVPKTKVWLSMAELSNPRINGSINELPNLTVILTRCTRLPSMRIQSS